MIIPIKNKEKKIQDILELCRSIRYIENFNPKKKTRESQYKECRYFAYYFLQKYKNELNISCLKNIDNLVRGEHYRDHAVVLNGIKRINQYIETEQFFKDTLDYLSPIIRQIVFGDYERSKMFWENLLIKATDLYKKYYMRKNKEMYSQYFTLIIYIKYRLSFYVLQHV